MNKSKGFTIIELIVVIAIIAVLAAIVLVNVTGYINKSKDAAMKENLHSLQTDAAVFYDVASPTYASLCTTVPQSTVLSAITNTHACNSIADSWCACGKEYNVTTTYLGYFCVDQTGKTEETATDCTGSSYCGSPTAPVCP